MKPLVSCILATGRRRQFLKQAIKCFQRQTYENRELLIVDDGTESVVDLVPEDDRIRYLQLDARAPLGAKLNIGIEQARGQIIQKLDDDDYYAPEFLITTTNALLGHDPARSIVGFGCFLVLIAATGELKYSGKGWCAGGTLCFSKQLWESGPFRDIPRAVDWCFLRDHEPQRIKIYEPELYILVRHDNGHLWARMGNTDVTEHFRRRPAYRKSLRDLLPSEDWAFYEGLRADLSAKV
jgi:glycosyltransferase involved in cell wall biosynthesis